MTETVGAVLMVVTMIGTVVVISYQLVRTNTIWGMVASCATGMAIMYVIGTSMAH